MKTIILAGGLGTRLKSVSGNLPKPMVPVESRPFLEHLMRFFKGSVSEFILSTGYNAETISSYFGENFEGIPVRYSFENIPLGTGGAIKKAMKMCDDDNFLVLNGDTFFRICIKNMLAVHLKSKAVMSMALKPMKQFSRYGNLILSDGKIIDFEEKRFVENGFINGGIYLLNRAIDEFFPEQEKFSFEKDVLEKYVSEIDIYPYIEDAFFIDIGIPEDYFKIKENASIFSFASQHSSNPK